MTEAQLNALKWIAARNGEGVFDRNGVLIAAGERAPFMRSTWNELVAQRKCEFFGGKSGKARVRMIGDE